MKVGLGRIDPAAVDAARNMQRRPALVSRPSTEHVDSIHCYCHHLLNSFTDMPITNLCKVVASTLTRDARGSFHLHLIYYGRQMSDQHCCINLVMPAVAIPEM